MRATVFAACLFCLGSGALADTDAAFEAAFSYAATGKTLQHRAVAYAELSWASLQAGRTKDAKTAVRVAEQCFKALEPEEELPSRYRLAASQLKLGNVDAARAHFAEVGSEPPSQGELVAWFRAAADAQLLSQEWGAEAVQTALARWRTQEKPVQRGFSLRKLAPHAKRLGAHDAVRAAALELAALPELSLTGFEETIGALEALSDSPLSPAVRELVWTRLRTAEPGEFDEFVVPMISAALKGTTETPAAAVSLLRQLKRDERRYALLLYRYADLVRRSQEDDPGRYTTQLDQLIKDAWDHPGSKLGAARGTGGLSAADTERMRILYRALDLLHRFHGPAEAIQAARRVRDHAEQALPKRYLLNELYCACARLCGELAAEPKALTLLQETAHAARKTYATSREGTDTPSPSILFEALTACANSAAKLRVEGREALVRDLETYALAVLKEAGDSEPDPGFRYFAAQLLVACAQAERTLGKPSRARDLISRALSTVTHTQDVLDVLEKTLPGGATLSPELVTDTVHACRTNEDLQTGSRLHAVWGRLGRALGTLRAK